jgi:MtfA peptidase
MQNQTDSTDIIRVAIAFFAIMIYLYFQVRYSDTPLVKKNFKRYLPVRNLESVYKPYLEQYFSFYNSLDNENKLMFEKRVQRFIDIKQFVPRGITEVTPEMKAAIAGTAIQLTFGYPGVYFSHFWRILVYPNSYYSSITHRYHMGEVDIRGMIVLSWKGFQEGFANPTDGHNLGYHEMAHALRLANIIDNDDYNFSDQNIMDDFDTEARKEAQKIRNAPGEASIFKGYFLPDRFEFFSVAVECFFEKPDELKNHNPKLYFLLTRILKIDPLFIRQPEKENNIA